MGCCANRNLNLGIEEKLCAIEKNLNFSRTTAHEIDRISHRYSTDLVISAQQFIALCKELKLEENSLTHEFLTLFFKNEINGYPVQTITVLGILLASGKFSDKISLLFSNYDVDSSGFLEVEEIKLMVFEITAISLSFIPHFASKKLSYPDLDELEKWRNDLASIRGCMNSYFANIILEDLKRINSEQFKRAFEKDELSCLMSTHELRMASQKVLRTVKETAELVDRVLKDPESLEKSLVRQISLKLQNRKRRKNIK
jgi:hypothetical protein